MLFEDSKYLWAQYLMLLEHRVRVLIIKCAVEIIQNSKNNTNEKNNWKRLDAAHLLNTTPKNFINGMNIIRDNKYLKNIPYLLHIFIELFGGFYIQGCEDDIKFIGEASGIEKDDVVNCLEILNVFFPTKNGWFQSSKNIKRLKFLPLISRGVGVFARQEILGKEYNDYCDGMGWLLWKYHNNFVILLHDEIGVEDD